jgi:ABC-type polysaccharide/polyol phosphate transport system ATPase subunit
MVDDYVLEVNNVSMRYVFSMEKVDSLKEFFFKKVKGQVKYKEFYALRDISFKLSAGDILGVIGHNGAGKSTLLKIISGVIKPTSGSVEVKGRIAPMIELGAGFDENLSGRENIYLNGLILGYPKSFLREKEQSIVEFAELGEFIDIPVKNYSSGMKARLGFSIATCMEPQILIVDEVLSVGDAKFQKKCHQRMQSLIDRGTTILLVSHSLSDIQRLCSRVLWLEKGSIKVDGPTQEVLSLYSQLLQ